MEKGLLTLQSAEMFSRCAFRVAVRVTGGDVEAIEKPQPVFQVRRRLRDPDLERQGRPEAAEGVPPGLLPQRQVQGLEGFLHRLVSSEAGPFMAARLHRFRSLLKITNGLLQPVGCAIRQEPRFSHWSLCPCCGVVFAGFARRAGMELSLLVRWLRLRPGRAQARSEADSIREMAGEWEG